MNKLKKALYLSQAIRQCEYTAVHELGLTADELMLRAGTAAFRTLKTLYPNVKAIAVFCGGGNNAGDGYVLAHLAQNDGFFVVVHAYKAIEELPEPAYRAALAAIEAGVSCQGLEDVIDGEVELIVDALLGLGLKDEVKEPLAHAIHLLNDSGLPILSLDMPSGLDADTGQILGACIRAAVTITFIAPKPGLFTLEGPDYCGKIICHSLHLEDCVGKIQPAAYLLDEQLLKNIMPPRLKNSHKGMYGHVLIIGGDLGMPGAVYLAALAALRVGAGVVSVAMRPEHVHGIFPGLPEVMVHGIENVNALLPLLAKASICVIGPGLGESDWGLSLFNAAMAAQLPLVIDAQGLRMLARHPQHDDNWVLTPHPAEASDLLDCSTMEIQQDRCQSAKLIQEQYGGCVVLKGAGSIVNAGAHETYICPAGNPGMATAGMGDVLSGVIGGLLAQGLSLLDAAKLGVWLHAHAADEAVISFGERGLIASDLMPYLRRQINKLV